MKDSIYIDQGYKVVRTNDKLSNHVDVKHDSWTIGSKKKLKASIKHKMKRIFVGVLDALDIQVQSGNLSKEAFQKIRTVVLNQANDQIRHMEMEIDNRYNIEALNYQLIMPVVGPGSFQGKVT